MKKFLAIFLAACLCFSLAACGSDENTSGTEGGSEGEQQKEPLGEHKHVYTNKSACDLCGEEWHATETDAFTFMPVVLEGVDGYDVMFGEYIEYNFVVDEFGRPTYGEPITSGKPYEEEEIVLPCVHEGKPVISVGYYYTCVSKTVKRITIPDSVFSFGSPNGSGDGAFPLCESLEELVLPYEVNLGSVGGAVSSGGGRDALPLSLSALFKGGYVVNSPISQNYQDGALYIGDYLIHVKSVAGRIFTVREGTKGIAAAACRDLSDVEEIRIPDSVTEIGDAAFTYTYIPVDRVSQLKKVVFGENSNLKKIDCYAFYGGRSLTEIDFPDTLESIGEQAFEECNSLSELRIPDSVRRVGWKAFYHTAYESENIMRLTDTFEDEYVMQGNEVYNGNCLIKVNPDFEGHYTVREGTTAIAGGAFLRCNKITSVTLPEGLTAIEAGLFMECSMESVELPKSVKIIGDYAFQYCRSLTSLTIPEGVTEIGMLAFYGCESLSNVTISEGVKKIGLGAFRLCTALENITFPEGVTEIAYDAFGSCGALKKIVFPKSLKGIGEWAMSTDSLTEIEFHGTVGEWFGIIVTGMGKYGKPQTIQDVDLKSVIGSGDVTVVCTDGTIAKDGTVTKQ